MKLPSFDNTKSLLLLGGAIAVGYVAYRAYNMGGDIAANIGKSLSDTWNSITNVFTPADPAGDPASPDYHETKKLLRQQETIDAQANGNVGDSNSNPMGDVIYDPTVIAPASYTLDVERGAGRYIAIPQVSSPDSLE